MKFTASLRFTDGDKPVTAPFTLWAGSVDHARRWLETEAKLKGKAFDQAELNYAGTRLILDRDGWHDVPIRGI